MCLETSVGSDCCCETCSGLNMFCQCCTITQLPISFWVQFKVVVLSFKALCGMELDQGLLVFSWTYPSQCSQLERPLFPRSSRVALQDRAFSAATPQVFATPAPQRINLFPHSQAFTIFYRQFSFCWHIRFKIRTWFCLWLFDWILSLFFPNQLLYCSLISCKLPFEEELNKTEQWNKNAWKC